MVISYDKTIKFGVTVYDANPLLVKSCQPPIFELERTPFGAAKDRSPRSPRRIIQVSLTLHTTQAPDAEFERSETWNSNMVTIFFLLKELGRL